jgi:enoyl-CoA hydratase
MAPVGAKLSPTSLSASREDEDERHADQDLCLNAAHWRRNRLALDMSAVKISRQGAVLTITLDRPAARNAVDRATANELADAFRAFEVDETAAVAVLWGDGGTFCAGADLRAFSEGAGNRVEPDGDGPMGPTRLALSKPVIAAVSGYAVAGGLELALWCDLRIVEEDAIFGVFCRRWGVPLIDGGTVRLPRLIGLGRALDMILTGRPVGAEEALAIGLATRVVPKGRALASAQALGAEIARFPAGAMRGDRRSAYEQSGLDLDAALAREFRIGVESLVEARKGAERFVGGRGRGGAFDDF